MNSGAQEPFNTEEDLQFLDEAAVERCETNPWKILIADDDEDVHLATKLVLKEFEFKNRGLAFLDAYDAKGTCDLIRANPDTAVVLLDVVMESTDAGLRVVQCIREEVGNHVVRIILRTGQPGHAPEKEVVLKYHINDYKAKSELTVDKLYTSLVSALRSYEDLQAIESSRLVLAKVLDAASSMDFRSQSLFVSGLLMQLRTLLDLGEEDLLLLVRRRDGDGQEVIMAAVDDQDPVVGKPIEDALDPEGVRQITKAFSSGESYADDKRSIVLVPLPDLIDVAVYIGGPKRIQESEQALIEKFCLKIVLAHQNFEFVEQSRLDQYAEIALLAKVTGRASFLTIPYMLGYGRLSRDIAQHMREQKTLRSTVSRFPEVIERAAMFADIGNDSIPSSILEKPSELSPDERAMVRSHPERGDRLLREVYSAVAVGRVVSLAREVALTHHECFDGTGYPSGLKGEDIPISGRIVAVANCYMALMSRRPWRQAYNHDQALGMIRSGAGKQFDPKVVDSFVEVIDDFRKGPTGGSAGH